MDPQLDPSYAEWVKLKEASSGGPGHDVVELASSLIEELYQKIASLEAVHVSASRDFEQKTHKLEKLAQTHQQATQNALYELNLCQSQSQALQESLNVCRSELSNATKSKMELEERCASLSRQLEASESLWRDQIPLQERRASQLASQSDQLKSLNDQVTRLVQEKLEIANELNSLKSSSLSSQYDFSLLKNDYENVKKQLEVVQSDFKTKSNEWREKRIETINEMQNLENSLQTCKDENISLHSQLNILTKQYEEKETLVRKLQGQIEGLQIGGKSSGDQTKILKLEQLSELYKSKLSECETQKDQYKKEYLKLKDDFALINNEKVRLDRELAEKQNEIQTLQIQVANLSEGLPDNLILTKDQFVKVLTTYFGSELDLSEEESDGAKVMKLIENASQSDQIIQVITLQQKYEVATAQLIKERNESRKWADYFAQIESEMARREPILKENQRQYELALSELKTLKEEHQKLMRLSESKDAELALQARKMSNLNSKLQQTSIQLQQTLYNQQNTNQKISMLDITSIHERNLELEIENSEIKNQNYEVIKQRDEALAQVNLLNESYHQLENTITSLELALSQQEEIQKMQNKRQKRKQKIEEMDLTNSNDDVTVDEEDDDQEMVDSSHHSSADEETQKVDKSLRQSQSASWNDSKSRINELIKNMDDISKDRDEWKSSYLKISHLMAQKEADLERYNQRILAYQSNHTIHEEQIEELRNRLNRASALIEKYERQLDEANSLKNQAIHDSNHAQQQFELSKFQIKLLQDQVDQYCKALSQSREEWQILQNHVHEATSLLQKKESNWIESSSQYESRISKLQSMLEETQNDADEKMKKLQDSLTQTRNELLNANLKLNHQNDILKLKEQSIEQLRSLWEEQKSLLENAKRSESSNQHLSTLSAPTGISSIESRSNTSNATLNTTLQSSNIDNNVSQELESLKRDLNSKNEEISIQNEHLTKYKQLVLQAEESLKNLQDQHESLKKETTLTVSELEDALEEAKKEAEQNLQNLSDCRIQLSALQTQLTTLETDHRSLTTEKSDLEEELNRLKTENETLKIDSEKFESTLKSTRSNYQHQVQELSNALHQNDVLQNKLEKVSKEKESLQEALEKERKSLSLLKAEALQKDNANIETVGLLNQRIQDSVRHIAGLSTEIEMLKSQLKYWKSLSSNSNVPSASAATSAAISASASASILAGSESMDSSEALMMTASEVEEQEKESNDAATLAWVKREYEITLTQLSLLQHENHEKKAEIEVLRERIEQILNDRKANQNEAIDGHETNTSENRLQTESKQMYEKLQAQMDQINLLRESNSVLRQQKTEAESAYRDAHERLVVLEKEKENLQANLTRVTHERDSTIDTTRRLTQQNEHWKGRVQELLTKYKDIESHAIQQDKIDQLTTQNQQLSQENQQLNEKVEQIEQLHLQINENNTQLNMQIEQLNQHIHDIEQQIVSSKDEIERLQNEFNASQSRNEKLQNTIQSNLKSASLKYQEYESAINEYKEQLSDSEGENEELKKQLENLQAQLANSKNVSKTSTQTSMQTSNHLAEQAQTPSTKITSQAPSATPQQVAVTQPKVAAKSPQPASVVAASKVPPPASPKTPSSVSIPKSAPVTASTAKTPIAAASPAKTSVSGPSTTVTTQTPAEVPKATAPTISTPESSTPIKKTPAPVPAPPKAATSLPAPPKTTTAPAPPKTTTTAPAPPKTTTTAPAPPKAATPAPAPPKAATTLPPPPKTTTTAPAPPKAPLTSTATTAKTVPAPPKTLTSPEVPKTPVVEEPSSTPVTSSQATSTASTKPATVSTLPAAPKTSLQPKLAPPKAPVSTKVPPPAPKKSSAPSKPAAEVVTTDSNAMETDQVAASPAVVEAAKKTESMTKQLGLLESRLERLLQAKSQKIAESAQEQASSKDNESIETVSETRPVSGMKRSFNQMMTTAPAYVPSFAQSSGTPEGSKKPSQQAPLNEAADQDSSMMVDVPSEEPPAKRAKTQKNDLQTEPSETNEPIEQQTETLLGSSDENTDKIVEENHRMVEATEMEVRPDEEAQPELTEEPKQGQEEFKSNDEEAKQEPASEEFREAEESAESSLVEMEPQVSTTEKPNLTDSTHEEMIESPHSNQEEQQEEEQEEQEVDSAQEKSEDEEMSSDLLQNEENEENPQDEHDSQEEQEEHDEEHEEQSSNQGQEEEDEQMEQLDHSEESQEGENPSHQDDEDNENSLEHSAHSPNKQPKSLEDEEMDIVSEFIQESTEPEADISMESEFIDAQNESDKQQDENETEGTPEGVMES